MKAALHRVGDLRVGVEVGPCGGLVPGLIIGEAPPEAADEFVRQSARCGVVVIADLTASVVERSCPGRPCQGRECPPMAGVGKSLVSNLACFDIVRAPRRLVIGAVPANARIDAGELKRSASSTISASRRAPRTSPRPGADRRTCACGWELKVSVSCFSSTRYRLGAGTPRRCAHGRAGTILERRRIDTGPTGFTDC